MPRKKSREKGQPRGCAELIFRITKTIVNDDVKISDIHIDDYMSVLPSPVPLQEVDSPDEVFKMYMDGALLTGSDSTNSKKEEKLYELPRLPSHGDIVLLHFNKIRATHCFMITNPKHLSSEKLKIYEYYKEPKYKFGMINLGRHENFQHKWNNR